VIRSGPTVQYDADNEVMNNPAYQYDQAGNPTTYQNVTMAYEAESHLTQVGPNSAPALTAGYNGDGLRAWKQDGTNASTRVYYLYDGTQPVVEFNSTGTVLKAANTFGPNGLLSRNVSGTSTFYTFDPQGSVAQRFDRTGNLLSSDEYHAFGVLKRQTPSQVGDVFGYGAQWGYQTDNETGLLLLTNRYYDPWTGRFLNRDPLSYAGGANLYGYAGNNPSSYADPLGLITARQVVGLGGAALGSFGGPVLGGFGYLAGLALYDAVEHLGSATGCNEGGYASTSDVVHASLGVAVAAASIVPGAGAAQEVEEAEAVVARTVTVVERDGEVVRIVGTGPKGTVEVIASMTKEGDQLILRGAHIDGPGPATMGIRELGGFARQLGQQEGASEVVVEGAARTTGARVGHIPRPFVFKVE
jgi:RHS repeat-associated protein